MSDDQPPPPALAALIQQVQAGDEHALAALVEHYADVLRRAAQLRLGNQLRQHVDSDDLVQAVHLILLQGLREKKFEFSDHQQFLNLALTLIRRRAARHWRQLKNEPESGTHGDGVGMLAEVPDPSADGLDGSGLTLEVNERFDRVLESLDPIDRRTLELRMAGHTTAEAARELGIEPATLRVRLGRLRKELREAGILDEWV